ncbi:MAG: RluA family pseudouridine synthase [Thermoleophilia bacterium]
MRGSSQAGEPLTFFVEEAAAGRRLDVFLAECGAAPSRSAAASLLARGAVVVDGRVRPKSYRLEAGQRVEVLPSFEDRTEAGGDRTQGTGPQAETIEIPVPYEDEWLLVADKPAGMVVHPAKGHACGTLVNALLAHGIEGGEGFRPGIVHRLDRDTSGLLIVAKDPDVHRRLQQLLQSRRVERRYLALVHGDISAPSGTIEAPIGRDPVRRKTMTVAGSGARPAVTHFRTLERLPGFTLVEARLETGRTHQIRVHFLAVGHPVAGDPVYARRDPLGLGRQFLHSHRLSFEHPVTGEVVEVSSPLPEALTKVLAKLKAQSRGEEYSP